MSENITSDLSEDFYTDAKLVTGDSQPIYLIQRDTIKAFLHEKIKIFGIKNKLIGLLGIITTIVVTLVTVNIHNFKVISGSTIHGFFLSTLIIISLFFFKNIFTWIGEIKKCDVNVLAEELGSRAREIKPSDKS